MICNHLTESPSHMLTNRLCCVLIHASSLYRQRKNISINANSGGDSSPLLCICVYFCCHPNANLETLYEGIFLRQSDQR